MLKDPKTTRTATDISVHDNTKQRQRYFDFK